MYTVFAHTENVSIQKDTEILVVLQLLINLKQDCEITWTRLTSRRALLKHKI